MTKKCIICGAEIENGVNGCSMYDTCFCCKPIRYPKARGTRSGISWDELDALEGRCLAVTEE